MLRQFIVIVSLLACCTGTQAQSLDGARWIGASSADLPIYPDDLAAFRIDFDYTVAPDGTVSLRYGMDDPRLLSANSNIFNTQAAPGESFMELTVDADGKIGIFRHGYRADDRADKAVASYDASEVVRPGANHICIAVCLGNTEVIVNGQSLGTKGTGAAGNGAEAIAFPVIAGMAADATGTGSEISNLSVSNFRAPRNVIFSIPGKLAAGKAIDVPRRSMPQLKSSFVADPAKNVRKASVTATARGIYDMKVNGRRVTDDYFYPGCTQYNTTHLHHSFDITPLVAKGANDIDVQLGEGWWSGPSTYGGESWNFYGDRQSFIATIGIEYADGSADRFVTSPDTWSVSTDGPVVTASFFQGEIHDATVAPESRIWKPATEIGIDSTRCTDLAQWNPDALRPTFGDRVAAVDTLVAVGMTEPRPGVYVYDMGQNMAGVPLIDFSTLQRGQTATICYAEVLYPDMPQYAGHEGMIMTENLRAAMCRDRYTAAGSGNEVFSPRQTLHGYRFVEITGLDSPLPLEAVKSVPLSSIHSFRSGFECSDSLVNRLWENVKWSSLANFISIPTDCPQRNERLGWMGDISVFCPTATRIADVSALLGQFLQSVRDLQRPDGRFPDVAPTNYGFGGLLWGSAGITVPAAHFSQYGDTALLRDHYPAMKRYVDFILSDATDPATGIIVQNREWADLGDWLSPEYDRNDKSLLWECYFILDIDIMARSAGVLGLAEDKARYEALAAERRRLFADVYVDPASGKTRFSSFVPDKEGREVDTQASYALPIAMGVYTSPQFEANFAATIERENISDDHRVCPPHSLMTGFIGTAWISEALSRIGRDDLAYRLLTSTNYPSWLYPVTQGATSVWERLNSYTHTDGFGGNNGMNSFNHYSFGAVGNWLVSRMAGVDYADGKIRFTPHPDPTGAITYAGGWTDTPYGRAECSWRRVGKNFTIEISTPEEAVFHSPSGETVSLKPGRHTFKVNGCN